MKYRIEGSYGTFVIARVVEADNEDEAFEQTGIMSTLIDAGWDVIEAPEGEEWEIEEVTS